MKNKYIIIALILVFSFALGLYYLKSNKTSADTTSKPTPSPILATVKVEKFDIPVLMYHYIRNSENEDQLGKNLSVSPENFEDQINYLSENDYQTIKLEDLSDPELVNISNTYAQKKKPIVLTFDDGYSDAYNEAFLVLRKYDAVGTFFIITNHVDKDRYLNESQIAEMKEAGMEFGSHTLSHPDLTKISNDDAKNQLSKSKDNFTTFCYPSGRFNNEVVNLVKDTGYKVAVTTKIGIANETSNLLEVPRVRIEDVGIQAFVDKINYAYEYEIN